MKVLVTGGAGFIGSHVVEAFLEHGADVVVLDNFSTGSRSNLTMHPHLSVMEGDVTNPGWRHALHDYGTIVHLAAQIDVQTSIDLPRKDAEINVIGTINMLEAAREMGSKLILASSAAVYSEYAAVPIEEFATTLPTSPYGAGKLCAETYVQMYNVLYGSHHTILRFANVYGPRQGSKGEGGVVSIFGRAAAADEDLTVYGDGEQTRDFIHVQDIAAAIRIAAQQYPKGLRSVYNLGTGHQTSINQLIRQLEYAVDHKLQTVYVDARPGDIRQSALIAARFRRATGWTPSWGVSIGIEDTVDWFQENK